MLPVRLGVFTGIAAVCLWGLFSLLDSLQEPGLLRTAKATVVKGCDSLDSDDAREQCPALFCQKALIDAKLVPLRAQFEISIDRVDDQNERLVAGTARTGGVSIHFACTLNGVRVSQARRLEADEFDELVNSSDSP